jgi:hypothetical protein
MGVGVLVRRMARRFCISFPTVFMKQWIARLFPVKHREAGEDFTKGPPIELVFNEEVEDAPPVLIVTRERFRVCVFPSKEGGCEGCSAPMHWMVFQFRDFGDNWNHLLTIHEVNFCHVKDALDGVMEYLVERKLN